MKLSMKKLLLLFFIIITGKAFSQIPEDAIRYSWYPQNGTARINAVGGAVGSLGGDITSMFVNPAGIGFYNSKEVVLGLNFINSKNSALYRDNKSTATKNSVGLSPIGFVIGLGKQSDKMKSSTFALGFNQTANFNNYLNFSSLNNYSSYSETFAEEFSNSKLSIDDVLQSNSPYPFTSAPALYTYLIDTVKLSDGSYTIKAAPEYILDAGEALNQKFIKKESGGIYEIAANAAVNYNDKWFFGGTLGIPIVYYKSDFTVEENDTSSNSSNHFSSFTYNDRFTTSGAGINLKAGAIYRPKEYIRIGLAVHSPTFMYLSDKRRTNLITNLENPIGSFEVNSITFSNNREGKSSYNQMSPWKAILSGSYVFREVEDTRKQKGFLSADIEYVNHKNSSFRSANEDPDQQEKDYFTQLTKVVKQQYKGAFNFRVGGELKFNVIMARLGFAYYGNPYKNSPEKANQMLLSGGLGYRNHGFFIDLTYVHATKKDVYFPYRLSDRQNTYSTINKTSGQIMATAGFKL